MKISRSFQWPLMISRFTVAVICLFPSLLRAHPGHYHPEETDEFDFFSATLTHSHGALDFVLAGLVLVALAVAVIGAKPALRVSALAVGMVSLILLPSL